MAITYPRTNLHDIAQFEECRFVLMDRSELSRAASGEERVKEIGPPLWTAQFQTVPMEAGLARAMRAWLHSMDGGIGTFTAYDVRYPFPVSDPTGAQALSGVQINSLSGGALSLKGLPAAFVLSPGDYLAFDWGSGRRAFHEVTEGVTANGSGVTAVFAVRPHIRAGATVNATVTLRQPRAVWRMDHKSWAPTTVGGILTRYSWTATQVV
jgi:hypothetical protein